MQIRRIATLLAVVLALMLARTVAAGNGGSDPGAARTASTSDFRDRRSRAVREFADGMLLIHAASRLNSVMDGFRQDSFFYYFTGLADTVGAVLALDGATGASWLFLSSKPPFMKSGLRPEVLPGAEAEHRLGITHVIDGSHLKEFLTEHAKRATPLYYTGDMWSHEELPEDLLSARAPDAPAWLQILLQMWPAVTAQDAGPRVQRLMAVQSPAAIAALRSAAKATVLATWAGIRAIHPGISQRAVEASIQNACWEAGAHGLAFWPWAMAGVNAVFPRPFHSLARYDHLDRIMRAGELVRVDVGCEWDHYQGDLGRTVPVSGHYDDAEREPWDIFVAAYEAGVRALRSGVTVDAAGHQTPTSRG